ncbi:hypothetical protein EZV62_004704 [Acer yangbiense]|uniref:HMA domain-containing protein n=1 Tax=Acer yangbiense TaxID=1000413 RepID=A0A5C7IL04_9ROSI|nr:hypothetical protein EZV62_004704 [Acer yangbiense]
MAEKKNVTLMLLKVDLECSKCYKKVKKILCKFPQIQDQVYDEKNNTVMIKVVCCSPEKIRDKICCKGRGTIKSIEILKPPEKPPAPKPVEKPPAPKPVEKPPAPKPVEKPPAPKPVEKPPAPKPVEKPPAPKPVEKPPAPKPVEKPPAPKPVEKPPAPKPEEKPPAPAPRPVPIGFCCTECSEGRGGGPCYNPCYGQPVRYYDGYCGRPVYDSWGGGGYRGNYGSRCTEYYFNEDNSQGCRIM